MGTRSPRWTLHTLLSHAASDRHSRPTCFTSKLVGIVPRPPIVIDNYHYASNNTERTDLDSTTPQHGGAAGRRHADHPEAHRRLYQPSTPDGPTPARCGAWTPGGGPPRLTTPRWPSTSATLFEAGRAPATAALAVAAVRFRAKLAGQPDPAGEATARVLGGYRRTASRPGPGPGRPAERGRARRDSRHRRTSPHRWPGRRIHTPRRNAGAARTPRSPDCCSWAGCAAQK